MNLIFYSNIALQFIFEEYSYPQYVVEYINKLNRGIRNFHRELLKLHKENPDKEYTQSMKQFGLKLFSVWGSSWASIVVNW